MTVSVRYIGTSRPYFETGVTGKQTSWYPGQAAAVSDSDAALLLATGVFEYGETAGGKSANDNRTIQSFSTAVVGAAMGENRIFFAGTPNNLSSAAASVNDALLDSIIAANTTRAITIVFSQSFHFRQQHTARSGVVLEGNGKSAAITFVPETSNSTFFIWSRNSADSSQVMEEGQLIGCGVRNLYLKSDRSTRANALYMNGVDFPFLDCEIFGFKGYGIRMSNTRVGDGTRLLTYYNGYTDLTDGTNNVADIWVDSPSSSWDASNLLAFASIQSYYAFSTGILLDGAYSNVLGGSSLVVHQLPKANTAFEANFLVAFPTYAGSAAALGWTAGGVAQNEYAAMHIGAGGVATVANRLWQEHYALYNVGLRAKKNANGASSVRNRLGQGRFIGGQTLYTVLIDGGSQLFCMSAEITSASPYAANVTCDASTDVMTFSSVTAASMTTKCPPTGTPAFVTGTPPAGLANSLTYYLIRLTATTFKLARTYADAIAGTAIDFTDAGASVVIYAGGMPLCVLDGSSVVIDDKSYLNDGSVAAWHDDTSTITGMARTGPNWTLYPLARHEGTERVLFTARNVKLDATGDTAMLKMFGGRRYIVSKITAIQKSTPSCAGATVGIYSGAAGAGTSVVTSAAMTGLDTANKYKDLTPAATTAVVTGSDPVANVITPPNIYVSVAGAAGAVADFHIWGYPAD